MECPQLYRGLISRSLEGSRFTFGGGVYLGGKIVLHGKKPSFCQTFIISNGIPAGQQFFEPKKVSKSLPKTVTKWIPTLITKPKLTKFWEFPWCLSLSFRRLRNILYKGWGRWCLCCLPVADLRSVVRASLKLEGDPFPGGGDKKSFFLELGCCLFRRGFAI